MNYLSHFYFTQASKNCYYSLGTILPDLFRNHNKSWKFHSAKFGKDFSENPSLTALAEGWKLHVQVDKIFHSSSSFVLHSAQLRSKLAPIFTRLPIRPFFLAHIGYELSLDNLLIRNQLVDTDLFYQGIAQCDPAVIEEFLKNLGIRDTAPFLRHLHSFIENRYLEDYKEVRNIVTALDHIGSRVWQERFNETERYSAAIVIKDFLFSINQSYLEVFEYVENKITEQLTIQ